jgi:ATPase subunit of ABC transporter with duplicated ATPase domains
MDSGCQRFAGCAVVISHDRWFLDRIATHILGFEGDSAAVLAGGTVRAARLAPGTEMVVIGT